MLRLNLQGYADELMAGITNLAAEINVMLDKEGVTVQVDHSSTGLELGWNAESQQGYIHFQHKHQFFRGLGLFVQHVNKGESFTICEQQHIETVGPMFDLSRNGVLTVASFKQMLNRLALMGMNTVMLYMEDTYDIAEEPYFGYMRGKYSAQELREIDDYADQFGIEAFPSIQTLAHLEEFLKWESAASYKDTKGALLVGSEQVDLLVERMIQAASAPFRSRKIHIGMDEAEELGRGKYLDKNGYTDRFHIMMQQLNKVLNITRKLGLKAMMWSDMFLKLAAGHEGSEQDYYSGETPISEDMATLIPKDVDLVYWDYAHMEREEYARVVENHLPLGCNLVFAGAVWIFNTFGVNYGLSLRATESGLLTCKSKGIREVYATMWGDDGNEGNPFGALLGLQLYAEHAYTEGSPAWSVVAERTRFCTGVDAEAFLLLKDLDEVPGSEPNNQKQSNPSKFLLYQDVLLGLFDRQIEGLPLAAHYTELEGRIEQARRHEVPLDWIFEVPEKLSAVLKRKSELGIIVKQAYDRGDREALQHAATVTLPEIAAAVKQLRAAHYAQWMRIFKPFGWEVLDIRYGGVLSRLDTASARLLDYLDGNLAAIEELEQERLVYSSANCYNHRGVGWCSYYYRMASPNVFFHVMNPF